MDFPTKWMIGGYIWVSALQMFQCTLRIAWNIEPVPGYNTH